MDSCEVKMQCNAGVDCHVRSDSMNVCSGSSSADYVASNGYSFVNCEYLGSECDYQVLSVDVNNVNASPLQVKD